LRIIQEAFKALRRNQTALLIYLAVTVPLLCADRLIFDLLGGPTVEDFQRHLGLRVYVFVDELIVALGYALAQSIAFARLGKDIDRPLWKVSGDLEAVRRFFGLWFVLCLTVRVIFLLAIRAGANADGERLAAAFLYLYFMSAALYIPVGSCLMFHGGFQGPKPRESLAPLVRQLSMALGLVLFGYLQVSIMFALSYAAETGPVNPLWVLIPAEVLDAACNLFAFSWAWLICIVDRNRVPHEDIDLD